MVSLYAAVTGGLDWVDMSDSLSEVGESYRLFFYVYVAFFLFVITNTLISLFVEMAVTNADKDHQGFIAEELRRYHEHVRKIKFAFHKIARKNEANLTKDDFEKMFADPEMLAFMGSLEIAPMDLVQFFNILSNNGKTAVDIEQFVVGCMKLKGAARSMDLVVLIDSQKRDSVRLSNIQKQLGSLQTLIKKLSGTGTDRSSSQITDTPEEERVSTTYETSRSSRAML